MKKWLRALSILLGSSIFVFASFAPVNLHIGASGHGALKSAPVSVTPSNGGGFPLALASL